MLSHLDKIQVEDIPEPEESVAAKDKEPLKEPEEMPATESLKEPEAASKTEEALEPDYDAITFPSDPVSSFGSVDEPKEEPEETVSEPKKEEKDNRLKHCYTTSLIDSNYIFIENDKVFESCYSSCGTCEHVGDVSDHQCKD